VASLCGDGRANPHAVVGCERKQRAIIRRAIVQYSADVTPLSKDLGGDGFATMLEQLSFTRDRGFVRLLTIDRGVRDYLVMALEQK
jgi:hypothetical protein